MARETFMSQTLRMISRDLPNEAAIKARREHFQEAVTRTFPPRHSFNVLVRVLLERSLSRAVQLLIVGQNAAVYVELSAVLERIATVALARKLGKDRRARRIIWSLIERKGLAEIAPCLVTLGCWTKDDLSFIGRLVRIRNSLAHGNEDRLRSALGSADDESFDSPANRLNRRDTAPEIIRAIDLVIKSSHHTRPRARPRARRPPS